LQTSINLPHDRPLTDEEIVLAVASAILNDRFNPGRDNPFQPYGESLFARLGIPESTGRSGETSYDRRRLREANPDLDLRLAEFCWRMVALGFMVPESGAVNFRPTNRGRQYLETLDPTALTPRGLDAKLAGLGFETGDPARQYARLAQDCFLAGHYESSLVLLRVASEALINDVADRLSGASGLISGWKTRRSRPNAVQNLDWISDGLTNHRNDLVKALDARGADSSWVETFAHHHSGDWACDSPY